MDLLTQIQGNIKAVAASLTNTIGYLNNQSPSVPYDYTPEQIPVTQLAQRADQLMQLLVQSKINLWVCDGLTVKLN